MVLLQRKLYLSRIQRGPTFTGGPDPLPPPPSGSAHENLHDVLIANLRCRASRPSDERISLTCIM